MFSDTHFSWIETDVPVNVVFHHWQFNVNVKIHMGSDKQSQCFVEIFQNVHDYNAILKLVAELDSNDSTTRIIKLI